MLALLAFWLAVDSTLKCNYFEWFGVAIWIRIAGTYQMSIESAREHYTHISRDQRQQIQGAQQSGMRQGQIVRLSGGHKPTTSR